MIQQAFIDMENMFDLLDEQAEVVMHMWQTTVDFAWSLKNIAKYVLFVCNRFAMLKMLLSWW